MRKKATRKRPYFTMESAMTAILRNASGKMHHGILFAPPLLLAGYLLFCLKKELSVYPCFKVNKKLINLEDNRRSNGCVRRKSGWGCTRISLQY